MERLNFTEGVFVGYRGIVEGNMPAFKYSSYAVLPFEEASISIPFDLVWRKSSVERTPAFKEVIELIAETFTETLGRGQRNAEVREATR